MTGPAGLAPATVAAAQAGWARHLAVPVEATVSLDDGVDMTFALIPPGTFRMGSPADEVDRGDDETLHPVTLTRPYFIGTTEVTQAKYRAITGKTPADFRGDDRPVERVTWFARSESTTR